ncbi:MAG TPA: S41 family peptidase [Pseudomonadota bacterium]|nr:S41 family peptidase [Pseudomonadota bacterium]
MSATTAANLGLDWNDVMQRLEAAFADAPDLAALREAIDRLSCSLHDAHLGYEPGVPGEELRLGLTLDGTYADGHTEFRVRSIDDPALKQLVQPDDALVVLDGIPVEQLARLYLDRTRANNWPAVARGVARYLTRRSTAVSSTRPGDVARWRLRRPTGSQLDVELRWQRAAKEPAGVVANRIDPDYRPTACHPYPSEAAPALPTRRYDPPDAGAEGYRITGYGRNFCLYTSERPPYRDYPIVRHFSFFYYARFPSDLADDARLNNEATYAVAAEYFALSRLLRARPYTRGLIVDLRDNGGGNDPEWFLDWYAPAPYEDIYDAVRVDPERLSPSFIAAVSNLTEEWLGWYRTTSAGLAPGTLLRRPFKCLHLDCSGGNRFTPARALLPVPVALLVGQNCHSSCAHLAHIFDENDFGPLIGEPAAATLTGQVYSYPVRTRSGLLLGRIGLAVSAALSGKSGQPIEGALSTVDYPIKIPQRERASWDVAHITAALRAFREYRFPRQVTPLGP